MSVLLFFWWFSDFCAVRHAILFVLLFKQSRLKCQRCVCYMLVDQKLPPKLSWKTTKTLFFVFYFFWLKIFELVLSDSILNDSLAFHFLIVPGLKSIELCFKFNLNPFLLVFLFLKLLFQLLNLIFSLPIHFSSGLLIF